MNPFVSRITGQSPIVPLSIMAFVLGFMISVAWITNDARAQRIRSVDPDQAVRIGSGDLNFQDEYKKLKDEVLRLRVENTALQNAMAKETGEAKVLNESLQSAKVFAGLTEVEGPGIVITLNDGKDRIDAPLVDMIVHDTDVLKVVNELWNAGAEAVSVNGNRVVTGTNFRCVGSVILVDSVKIATPVVVQAIGAKGTLIGAMKLPGGIVSELQSVDARMAQIAVVEKMQLPAYGGATELRNLRPVEAKS